jgi:hypothetical protein
MRTLRVRLVVKHSPASKGVKMEDEGATVVKAVTRRRPVKIEQIEKTWFVL